ncbi:PIN domain-containing protein [uncultured Thiothrix sp.]|uniref:PIN domain-containing protein n=1 Tax=uncultured Thiothrix sp. TaxID=223185 RepID=UPI002609E629|nr:type II toxin-antitoxin system VapC family toxin [uncultured Thiothrix sp.]
MKALDTNVLARFLMNDDELQAQQVYQVFKAAEAARERFYVSLLVIIELIWVLESCFKLSRLEVLEALQDLMFLPVLDLEGSNTLQSFIAEASTVKADLSDLLIAHQARHQGCIEVYTFDRKALRCPIFSKLSVR